MLGVQPPPQDKTWILRPVLSIVGHCLPFFLLVLAGYGAARLRWLGLDALPGLNTFVLFFALPALLFRLGRELVQQADAAMLLVVYGLASLALLGLAWRWLRRLGRSRLDSGMATLAAAFPNSGFLGVPLIGSLLGPAAAAPVVATIAVDLLFTSTVCLALASPGAQAGATEGARPPWREALRPALRNPLAWAIALGLLAGLLQLQAPAPLERSLALLAQAASPTALFALGLALRRTELAAHGQTHGERRQARREALGLASIKLLVHPMLVGGLAWGAQQLGLLGGEAVAVLLLVAALPCAANVALLTERVGADNALVSRAILSSTLLALGSLPLLAWWLRG